MPVAESLGLATLKWVASPVIKDLVKKSIAYLGNNITEGLEDLKTTLLPQFQLTIQAAENSPHKAWVAEWLLRLKNAYYDAEGILHALEYKHLRRKARGKQSKIWVRISSYPVIKSLAKYTGKINKKVSLLSPQKRKLINQLNKLKKIAAEAKRLRELLKSTETRNEIGTTSDNSPPVIGSQLPDKVFGRGYERDEIIDFLLNKKEKGINNSTSSSKNRSYPVVAITGIGGAGKTTLARYVYDDESVKQHFSARMWICLSKKMDAQDRTKEMIECITKKRPDLTNLSELQNILKDALLLEPKQVLLVLDNFWAHDTEDAENEQWKNLLVPFNYIKDRFKILTTSRANKFPISLIPAKLIQLRDLEDDYFLELFRYYAGLEISNSQLQNDFYDDIAKKIVCKLSRSPLAARAVGDRLYENRDTRFWQDIERTVNLSDTMKVLLWSFQLMDVPIQRCFLFCAVFPRGTWCTGYDLVQYWIALDYIQPSDSSKGVEDVGFDYFQMMVKSSIFQSINGIYYMHDLYRDLAEQLSAGDCFRVENGQRDQIPSTTLHLYLNADDGNLKENLSSICNLRNLRTFILEAYFIKDQNDIFSVICKNCKNLRVLDVWSDCYKILPSVVGGLQNLRYLNVWEQEAIIQELPDSMLQLYHLQFLILPSSLLTLPTKLGDLIKLRSVGKYDTDFNHVTSLPPVPYLGKLTSLQHLDEFHVRREEGYGLEQLGCLREIGGTLRIVNLENVRNEDEAVVARLIDKPKLDGLELVWAESADNIGSEFEVINSLQPPPSLETLTIDGYSGSRCPTWLHEGSTIPILASIRLLNCNALTILPSNFHQFRCCSELVLDNLGALKELPSFPENLARLQISKCPCLILISENELQVNENQGIMETQHLVFTVSLEELLAHELASFKQTGSRQNCMEQLQIIESAVRGNYSPELSRNISRAWWRCHQQRLDFIFRCTTRSNILKSLPLNIQNLHLSYLCLSDGALLEFLKGMTNLENLYLEGIMTITTLPSADVLQSLQSLRDLTIYDCWCLRSLSDLHALPQLQKIHIINCPEISGLPELPSSVQLIEISGCPILTELCQRNGPEWHKIQHIKNKWID